MPRKGFLIILQLLILSFSSALGADDLSHSANESVLSLSGTAFADGNGDRILSENETGLANVTIRLLEEDMEKASALTDDQGRYAFANLTPGRYVLRADPVMGSNQTAPGGGYYEVTLSDQPGSNLNFGFLSSGNLAAALPMREHPLMHPSPEEVNLWASQYNSSARATLGPEMAARLAAAPTSYSVLDKLKYTPSERDQGQCGNCWAWAGTGVMEIDYARQMKKPERFSIQYLDSNYNGGCGSDGACCGGWLDDLAGFYQAKKIIVPWSNANAHYQDGGKSCGSCSISASQISTTPHYGLKSITTSTIATRGLGKEQAIEQIKGVLLQDKAVWFAFFLPDSSSWSNFYSFWGTQPESATWKSDFACGKTYNYQSGGGHAVLCVGYDDSDPNNRYWIMLNSWGTTEKRPAGLFRMNMDMNYDCSNANLGYAFYWMTLNMVYDDGQNHAPQVPTTPKGSTQGYISKSLTYTTTSTDTDGDTFYYTFDWGDASTSKTALSTSTTGMANHAWSQKGDFLVKARATDSKGASSDWSVPLAVKILATANSPPNKPSTPVGVSSGYVGRSYSYTTYATDPNRDSITYIFDWGDSQTTKIGPYASGVSVRAAHTWSQAGAYSVRVKAIDGKGGESVWSSTKTVTIKKAAIRQASPNEIHKKAKTCPCREKS